MKWSTTENEMQSRSDVMTGNVKMSVILPLGWVSEDIVFILSMENLSIEVVVRLSKQINSSYYKLKHTFCGNFETKMTNFPTSAKFNPVLK